MITEIPIRGIGAITIVLINTFLQTPVVYEFEVKHETEINISKPDNPEKAQLMEYFLEYGSPLANDEYIDNLFDISHSFEVDPLFIAALSILESSGGKYGYGYNYYGYCSNCTGFSSDREALSTVSRTIRGYNDRGINGVRQIASTWRTGGLNDTSNYPLLIEKIINDIRNAKVL